MDRVELMMKWTMVLDMIWSIVKASGASVELAINSNMLQVVAMEKHLIIARVIQGEGGSSKVTSPMGLTPFYSL